MDWTDEDVGEARKVAHERGLYVDGETLRAIMTRAVELAATRGGTMTAEEIASDAEYLRRHGFPTTAGQWVRHMEAIGARNAVLEAELALARKGFDAGSPSEATIRVLEEEAVSLKERLSDAEKANRELVRRAQKAEATSDMDRKEVAQKQRLLRTAWDERDGWRRRAEESEARCATLSVAGQVLSAHVDKAECHAPDHINCPCTWDPPQECRYPCSPTCTHDDAKTPDHPERVKERSEAFEQFVWSKERSADWRLGFDDGKERGAEAMRAACWEAVASRLEVEGYDRGGALLLGLKSAIEGAAP